MKKTIIIIFMCCCWCYAGAQDLNIEKEIRELEQTEVNAVLNKDTVTLKKLWDKDFVVNNPQNKIVLARPDPLDRPVLQNVRTAFKREVEKIIINGDIAISMGNETVTQPADNQNAGQTITRRYTNIWMKKDGLWKLAARHANVICR